MHARACSMHHHTAASTMQTHASTQHAFIRMPECIHDCRIRCMQVRSISTFRFMLACSMRNFRHMLLCSICNFRCMSACTVLCTISDRCQDVAFTITNAYKHVTCTVGAASSWHAQLQMNAITKHAHFQIFYSMHKCRCIPAQRRCIPARSVQNGRCRSVLIACNTKEACQH